MIIFDVSRLIARAAYVTPTGIDRVELAYARYWISGTKPACFVRANRWGGLTLLPQTAIERYVAALGALWRDGPSLRRRGRVRWAAFRVQFAGSLPKQALTRHALRDAAKPVYLLVSHHHLEKRRLIAVEAAVRHVIRLPDPRFDPGRVSGICPAGPGREAPATR